ncbi:MAG TPA: phosphatase PAP2 family protein [Puia sp.]|jgi:undecaprenyl-diphosphatase|nr:phosphatase PAP2 family protein [Puia sp.]
MDKKTGLKLSATEFLIASALLLLSIGLFSFIADEIVIENKNSFDFRIFRWFAHYTSASNTKIALFFTFFGSPYFMIPAYLVIMFYFSKQQKKKEAIMIGVVALISVLSIFLLKDIFHRHRPPSPLIPGVNGYSFPSGHSLSGFTFSGIMIYLIFKSNIQYYRKWIYAALLFLFAVLIGMSRIYLRVHFPSDVIAGLLVTTVWLSLTFIAILNVEKSQLKR